MRVSRVVASLTVASAAMASGMVAMAPARATVVAAAATPDPTTFGTTAALAAGSCWDVKQVNPSAASGVYWILTPAMTQPQQFYCDQTTDGGGWVLIGKGRDGWTADYDGKGKEADLTTPDLTPLSAATTELPSRRVDQLLNGGKVSDLTDGIRLRRAMDAGGTTWQESRMRFADRDRFVWTFGAAHALASFTFGPTTASASSTTTSGGTSSSYGTDDAYNRVNNVIQSSQTYHPGFAYGSQVTGTNSSTSYLWSATNGGGGALPYTQVWVRPKITSTNAGFTAIPDGGTAAAAQQAVASSDADNLPWHVSGLAGNTSTEGDVEVQALTQSGNRMYVGGNFKYVQKAADSTGTDQVSQPFLAAFDVNTGELDQGFRPVLNEQVHSLATLPNGDVVAGGEFSQANGQPATAIVALNPATGATDTGFKLSIENRLSGGVLGVRSLKVLGSNLYIGGAFTHLTGGSRTTAVYSRSAAIVSATTGLPRSDWNPVLNGTVKALDPSDDGTRVYAAGYFTKENSVVANHAAAISTAAGAPLVTPAWNPVWSNNNSYQQAIDQVGDRVFVGGSEHALFSFATSTFDKLTGHIMMYHGDIQGMTDANGVLYAGCHCDQFNYTNAFTWPTIGTGWTEADAINWFAAYKSSDGSTIPQFTPNLTMRLGSGIWAILTDSNGRVWAGGDMVTAATSSKASQWAGGFARFSPVDSTAPTAPSSVTSGQTTADTTRLTWTGSTDDSGSVTYEVLRDDRPIATTKNLTLTVPLGGNNRFFVRATDASRNVSASTPVLTVAPVANVAPQARFTSSDTNLSATFDASGSTDDSAVTSYAWNFGDGSSAAPSSSPTSAHTYTAGTYTVTLTVSDAEGLTSQATGQVTATNPPAGTSSVVIDRGQPWSWRYQDGAPPAGWNANGFDASSWASGTGALGFGSTGLGTNIDTFSIPSYRPVTAYFVKTFTVPSASRVTQLSLSTVADDGVVVYVNGTEVGRSSMPTGSVSYATFASAARNTATATSAPVSFDVPTSLLVDGVNTVAAETHLNYKNTRDASFDLKATMTSTG